MNKKINLLMITPDFPPSYGGIGTHVDELVDSLSLLGYNIYILVARLRRSNQARDPKIKNDFYVYSKLSNITVVEFNTGLETNFDNLFFENTELLNCKEYEAFIEVNYNMEFLCKVMKFLGTVDINFDIIHAHDGFSALVSVMLKKRLNIPLITTMHATNAPSDYLIDGLRRYIVHNSDYTICVSQALRETMKERYGLSGKNMCVINNGVRCYGNELTRKINNTSSCKEITFCGRIHPLKGCDILIKAFSIIAEEFSGLKLNIVGDGPILKDLKALVCELEIEESVEFLGYKESNEVRNIYRNSDLVVLPSRRESFGLVAIEAMAEGSCVIGSSVGGLKEIIQDRFNGVLVEPNNIQQLASIMEELLLDDEKRLLYAKNGYETVVNRFDWDVIAREISKKYNFIISEYPSQKHE